MSCYTQGDTLAKPLKDPEMLQNGCRWGLEDETRVVFLCCRSPLRKVGWARAKENKDPIKMTYQTRVQRDQETQEEKKGALRPRSSGVGQRIQMRWTMRLPRVSDAWITRKGRREAAPGRLNGSWG